MKLKMGANIFLVMLAVGYPQTVLDTPRGLPQPLLPRPPLPPPILLGQRLAPGMTMRDVLVIRERIRQSQQRNGLLPDPQVVLFENEIPPPHPVNQGSVNQHGNPNLQQHTIQQQPGSQILPINQQMIPQRVPPTNIPQITANPQNFQGTRQPSTQQPTPTNQRFPVNQHGSSQRLPAGQQGNPQQFSTVQPGNSQRLPVGQPGSSQLLPTGQPGNSQRFPTVQPGNSQQLPTFQPGNSQLPGSQQPLGSQIPQNQRVPSPPHSNQGGGAPVMAGKRHHLCGVMPMPGDCRGAFPRYYYNKTTDQCDCFLYGGCGAEGLESSYETLEVCHSTCWPGKISEGPTCQKIFRDEETFFLPPHPQRPPHSSSTVNGRPFSNLDHISDDDLIGILDAEGDDKSPEDDRRF